MPLPEHRDRGAWGRAALLVLLGLFMFVTNPWFTVIDDEAGMINSAMQSPRSILAGLMDGSRIHIFHPPLHDLLLHAWLKLTGGEFHLLRVPSILLYIGGLWFCSQSASRLGGSSAAWFVLLVGGLWPHGFHMGRVQGWYVLSFFFLAWLTEAYFRFLDRPALREWLLLAVAGTGLLYTNYFGWAMIGLLAIHYILHVGLRNSRWVAPLALMATWLAVFAPFYLPFWGAVTKMGDAPRGFVASTSFAIYNAYAFLAGESVAPWFLPLALPLIVALIAVVVLAFFYAPASSRYLLGCVFFLLAAMSVLGIAATKRALMLGPWMILPLATALAAARSVRGGRLLLVSWMAVVTVAAAGIVTRRAYAAPRWIEPWRQVAEREAGAIRDGSLVLGTNPSFCFYLTYALHVPPPNPTWHFAGLLPVDVRHPLFVDPTEWNHQGHPTRNQIHFVRGPSADIFKSDEEQAQRWLDTHCQLKGVIRDTPDSGFVWKQRIFPNSGQMAWRVEIREYACAESTPGTRAAKAPTRAS